MIIKRRYEYFATCDGCGAELPAEYDYLDAVGAMKRAGWQFVRPDGISPEWYHFCPACKERRKYG
jgi:hypothetical protein